jgi:F-type H+-transporting ATPase subunit gamma
VLREKVIKAVDMNDKTRYSDALNLAYFLESQIVSGEFDHCSIVYNRFHSVISYIPTIHPLIPFEKPMKTKVDCTKLFSNDSVDAQIPLFGDEARYSNDLPR